MLAENLARLQAERGETNYRLAKDLGVHQSSIANWKDGKIEPHPKNIWLLAEHFGVTVDELLSESARPPQVRVLYRRPRKLHIVSLPAKAESSLVALLVLSPAGFSPPGGCSAGRT